MADLLERLKAALADRYRIERELGSGGMATVYLARDLKHERQVAVKVLRPELAAVLGAERFLNEIKVTANLQHPHILALFDSGEADSFLYYVMPHVEGESLRERLNREKQLSIEESIEIAKSVASALDYAHRHEVIHRDIKPENILLHDGQPVVADFGIALAVKAAGGTRLTETGLSLGTPQYMSPEQATGDREIDGRSDIYSLACVLYEMLAGDPPHTGSTVQAVIAKVVTDQPRPITELRDTVPSHVSAVVHKSLAKLPADRFSSAADFATALTNPAFSVPTDGPTGATGGPGEGSWKRLSLSFAAVAVVTTVLALWGWIRPEPPRLVSRYGLAFSPGQELTTSGGFGTAPFALAPDGSWIVYVGPDESGGQLWVKPRDSYEAVPLSGTDGAAGPSVSPDGQWIAYTAGGELRTIRPAGGPSITLADTVRPGTTWLHDGTVVYTDLAWQLRRVPAMGGPPEILLTPEPGTALIGPVGLPESRGVLLVELESDPLVAATLAFDLRTGEVTRVIDGAIAVGYVPTGHLVAYQQEANQMGVTGELLTISFDLETLQTSGAAMTLMEGVGYFAFSADGTLLIQVGGDLALAEQEAVWVNRDGVVSPVDPSWRFRLNDIGNLGWALSPDGTRLAIGLSTEHGNDIWIKHLDDGPVSRLTFSESDDARPRWSLDGGSLLFVSDRSNTSTGTRRRMANPYDYDLYEKRADGTGQAALRLSLESGVFEAMITQEAGWIVVRTGGVGSTVGGRDIVGVRLDLDSTVPLLTGDYDETAAALSPDGRWLAYTSSEMGAWEVYVRPFPNVESGQWLVSTAGGRSPLWAHSGRELFYVSPANEMMSVDVETDPVFAVRGQRMLFPMGPEYVLEEVYTVFDISPDDRRFLMVRNVERQVESPWQLIVVENWFEELKEKVAQGND